MRKSIELLQSNSEETASNVFRKRFEMALAHDHLTHRAIAQRINYTQASFSSAINSKRMSLQFATLVAKALDLSLDWLCGLEDE